MTKEQDKQGKQQDPMAGAEQRFIPIGEEMLLSMLYHETRSYLTMVDGSLNLTLEVVSRRLENMERSNRDYTMLSSIVDWMHLALPAIQDIQDMMSNVRSSRGGISMTLRDRDIIRVVKSSVRDFQFNIGDKVSIVLPDHQPLECRFDDLGIRHVIGNLLNNAFKYGGGKGGIAVSVEILERHVRISVQDSGPGIPSEKQASIWNPFQRADTFGQPGLGLGLYFCKEVVNQHNGEIGVESEGKSGKGSKFWFTLPLTQSK